MEIYNKEAICTFIVLFQPVQSISVRMDNLVDSKTNGLLKVTILLSKQSR